MNHKLCIIACENFREEIAAVITACELDDVILESFPSFCGRLKGSELPFIKQIISRHQSDCSYFEIIGGACCLGIEDFLDDDSYSIHHLEQCFHLFTNKSLVDHLIGTGAYLVTPGWLSHWEHHISKWEFGQDTAQSFFKEFANRILLLNTDILPGAVSQLHQFSNFIGLPYEVVPVGLDYLTSFLSAMVYDWRLKSKEDAAAVTLADTSRTSADYAMAFQLLRELTDIAAEDAIIQKTLDLCNTLFAPGQISYQRIYEGQDEDISDQTSCAPGKSIRSQFSPEKDYTYTRSKRGFVVCIRHGDKLLGLLEMDYLAFPQYMGHYLALALSVGRMAGIAISNARKFEAVQKSEERFRQLIDILPSAIFVHYETKITFCNLAALNLTGFKSSMELYGRSILDFIPPHRHKPALRRFEKVLEKMVPIPLKESKIVPRDGKPIDVEIISIPFPYKEKLMILDVVNDIRQRKRIEQLKKRARKNELLLAEAREYERLRTEFFSNISHEFRTPLNVLIGTLQLMDLYPESCGSSQEKTGMIKYLRVMKQNSYRLLRLSENLIDITKIDSGFYEIHLEDHDIVEIIKSITLSTAEYIKTMDRNLLFDTNIEEKMHLCDRDAIERILLNLLSNAVKFTKPGDHITVTLAVEHGMLTVCVKDTGKGIPSDKISAVFERFRQVDKSLTREHEGSGIGLSLVKSLVELHKGTLHIQSDYGKGSEFIVKLPIHSNEQPIKTTVKIPGIMRRSQMEKIRMEFSDIYA